MWCHEIATVAGSKEAFNQNLLAAERGRHQGGEAHRLALTLERVRLTVLTERMYPVVACRTLEGAVRFNVGCKSFLDIVLSRCVSGTFVSTC
jgi:hypothetical protein